MKFDNLSDSNNPKDKISMDVPLFLRVLERAREEIHSDVELHDMVEKISDLSTSGETLSMSDYNKIANHDPVEESMFATVLKGMRELDEAGMMSFVASKPTQYRSPESQVQKHRVAVTVTDPDSSAVSQRAEKIQKIIRVSGVDQADAEKRAANYYKRGGYRVHEVNYIGVLSEKTVTEGGVKAAMMDLEELSDAEFQQKYNMTKAEMRAKLGGDVNENREREWDEGNTEPANNFAVYINGKKWKVFQGRGIYADDAREKAHYRQLQDWAAKKSAQTGKEWKVYITGESPTNEQVQEGNFDPINDDDYYEYNVHTNKIVKRISGKHPEARRFNPLQREWPGRDEDHKFVLGLKAKYLKPKGDVTETQQRLSIGQQMARDGITYSPEREREIIGQIGDYLAKNGYSNKQIRYYLSYDEDFIPDTLSELPRQGVTEADDDKMTGFDPKTMYAIKALQAKYPHAKDLMSALLSDIDKFEVHSDMNDISHDDRLKNLEQKLQTLIQKNDLDEANAFTDARMNAIKAGKDTFTVGGKTYKVTGDTTDEKQAAQLDELTGWGQASKPKKPAQRRPAPTAGEVLAKSNDKRSMLQRAKDAGNKNWFREMVNQFKNNSQG